MLQLPLTTAWLAFEDWLKFRAANKSAFRQLRKLSHMEHKRGMRKHAFQARKHATSLIAMDWSENQPLCGLLSCRKQTGLWVPLSIPRSPWNHTPRPPTEDDTPVRESWRRTLVHLWYPSSDPQQRVGVQLRQLQRWHPNFVVVCSVDCVEAVSEILDVLRGTRRYCQTATVLAVGKGVAVEDV